MTPKRPSLGTPTGSPTKLCRGPEPTLVVTPAGEGAFHPPGFLGLARILRSSGEPNVRAVLRAETKQFGSARWPSCIILGIFKRRR